MKQELEGRTAVVTGGSLGLGKAMAKEFHVQGANVAILARRSGPLEQARAEIAQAGRGSSRIESYVCDVTDPKAIEQVVSRIESELGVIDILVNNAGKSEAHSFMNVTDEIWQSDLDLKLFAAIRFCRLVFPGMCERRRGRIINLLNTAAKAPGPRSAPTSVSRAAGMALTKVLASEGAPYNVLVNSLLIGRIESDQSRRAYEASSKEISYEEFLEREGRSLPMGRMGEAQECANVALFLASDRASYLTGCAINMDGGLSRVV